MNRKAVWLVAGLLIALAAGLGFFWPFGGDGILRLHGTVEIQEVRLGSKVGGRVLEVLVREGQEVTPGTQLVIFEAPEREATRDQLKAKLLQARADRDKVVNGPRLEEKQAARAAAEAARARYEKLKFGWREEEKKQAASELETAQAELKQTELDMVRISGLIRQKAASQADLDAVRGARDRAKGRVHASQAKNEMMQAGSRKEEIAEAKAEWDKAKAQADLLEAGSRWEDIAQAEAAVLEAQARLEEAEVNLREAVVTAPDSVVIDVVAVRKGDIIPPNQPVLRVLRDEDLWVKVFVPENQVGKVQTNQEVEVFTDASPTQPLRGKVIFVDPISEFTPRNIQSLDERRHQVFGVKILVDNPKGHLRSGMAAEVHIPLK